MTSSTSTASMLHDPVHTVVTAFLSIVDEADGEDAAKNAASGAIRTAGAAATAEIVVILRRAVDSAQAAVRATAPPPATPLSRGFSRIVEAAARNAIQAEVTEIREVVLRMTDDLISASELNGLNVGPAMDSAVQNSFSLIDGLPTSSAAAVSRVFNAVHQVGGVTVEGFLGSAAEAARGRGHRVGPEPRFCRQPQAGCNHPGHVLR